MVGWTQRGPCLVLLFFLAFMFACPIPPLLHFTFTTFFPNVYFTAISRLDEWLAGADTKEFWTVFSSSSDEKLNLPWRMHSEENDTVNMLSTLFLV
jgi:hypothetical protein